MALRIRFTEKLSSEKQLGGEGVECMKMQTFLLYVYGKIWGALLLEHNDQGKEKQEIKSEPSWAFVTNFQCDQLRRTNLAANLVNQIGRNLLECYWNHGGKR